jgi:hypothetical protein
VQGIAERIRVYVRQNRAGLSKTAYFTAAGLLFALAMWNRFSLPQDPLATPDQYLWPAVIKLSGGAFVHLQGLNFLYPGMVYVVLRTCGDFRAIAIFQQVLGLTAGGLFLASWSRLAEFFPRPLLNRATHEAMGLLGGGIYLLSTAPILFEKTIRSDAVCMFFQILIFWLIIEFFYRRVVAPNPCTAVIYGIAAAVSAFLLASFKPSFTLMALFTAAPVVWSILCFKNGRPAKLVFFCVTVFTIMTLTLAEHHLRRNDETVRTFLPMTLFVIHAKIIHRQMLDDLSKGETGGYSRDWLRAACDQLGKEIHRTHVLYPHAFPRLGFQPDYLHYGPDSLLARWRRELGDQRFLEFLSYWYRRSLAKRPLSFVAKIAGQLRVFYSIDCPAFSARKRWPLSSWSYSGSWSALSQSRWRELLGKLRMGSAFLQRTQSLRTRNIVVHQNQAVQLLHVCCARTYLPILLISVPLAGWFLLKKPRSDKTKWPAFWVLFFYSATFGNVLGVSVVHSIEVPRYSTVLFISALFAQLWAIRWLIELSLAAVHKTKS